MFRIAIKYIRRCQAATCALEAGDGYFLEFFSGGNIVVVVGADVV